MVKLSTFIVALLLLLPTRILSATSGGWQGYGNMSSSNLTVIFSYVRANISTALTAPTTFCTQFSTYLNSQWDHAWNVFFINSAKDAVLYGYAFRNHWMWYNGYITNGQTVGFVLWKDYNCQGWKTVGVDIPTGFSNFDLLNSAGDTSPLDMSDIWGATYALMQDLVRRPNFSNGSYSVVASQQSTLVMYGYVCMVGNNQGPYSNWASNGDGSFVVFQTR